MPTGIAYLASKGLPDFPGQDIAYLPNCNKISTFNGSPVQYDGAGNPIDDYIYNDANRLSRIDWNAESMSLIYNGAGELVRTRRQPACNSCGSCPPAIRHYYHFASDGRALGMVDISVGNNPVERDWIWLDGIPVAQIQESYLSNGTHLGTQITYLHTDHLGTPRLGTDENGDPTWVYQSDAFGKSLAYNADVTMPLRMPGQIDYSFGPEGLYYNYYRDYDSDTGRYLESDPVGLAGGVNTYSYVGANPLSRIDPLGLVDWAGQYFVLGGGIGPIGGGVAIFTLTSQCVAGERYFVRVRGSGLSGLYSPGATTRRFSAGFGETGGSITLSDGLDVLDPYRALEGDFFYGGAGLAIGIGYGFNEVHLGQASTNGIVSGVTGGIEFGLTTIAGRAKLLWAVKQQCADGCN